jgi:ATPase subunit of ABC transporter with duplicated ATPase domains
VDCSSLNAWRDLWLEVHSSPLYHAVHLRKHGLKEVARLITSTRQAVVSLQSVSKSYGTTNALDCLTLDISNGSITATLGPNGAGKSTMMSLIFGLMTPDSGKVKVFDHDPAQPVNRRKLGAMQQSVGAPDTLRIIELIRLWSSYYDQPLPLETVIVRAGLTGIEKRRFGELSGAQHLPSPDSLSNDARRSGHHANCACVGRPAARATYNSHHIRS